MSPKDLDTLAALTLSFTREAAALVAGAYRSNVRPDHKGPVDLVTEYDRRSEDLLRERLSKATPYPITGEEGGGSGDPEGMRWYVDPIDGTTNFVHGHPFYCVSVGLLRGSEPILGVVVAPSLQIEWVGKCLLGSERAATRNGEPCAVSPTPSLIESLLATGFPYDRASADSDFDAFVTVKKRCRAVRRCGSAALDLCFVADGTYDGYWERNLKSWDVAAGAAITLAAGGMLSDYSGKPVDVRSGELVATNGRIHASLTDELKRIEVRA